MEDIMKKKLLALLLAMCMVLTFTACGGEEPAGPGSENCKDCDKEPCVCEEPGNECTDCGADPCECEEECDCGDCDCEECDCDCEECTAEEEKAIHLKDHGSFCGVIFDAEVAGFEVGEAYTLEVNVHAIGTTGFRFRYTLDHGEDGFKHNDAANSAHSTEGATADGLVASQVPALFGEGTVAYGSNEILVVNFIFGEDIADLDPVYMPFIGIFGFQGGDSYDVLGARILDADGNVIAEEGDMEG
jgi:hypothetical protein